MLTQIKHRTLFGLIEDMENPSHWQERRVPKQYTWRGRLCL